MSTTLVQMRTRIYDWLATTTTRLPAANLTDIINMAVREIARNHDLRLLEVESTVSLVQGTASYALPAVGGAFSRPFNAYLLDPNDTTQIITLNQVSYDDFRAKWGITTSVAQGVPEDWTIFTDTLALRVGPTPNAAMSLLVDYFIIPSDLSLDAEHNALTDYATDAVFYKAAALASIFMLEDERAVMFDQMYQREIAHVLNEQGRSRYGAMGFPQMTEPH